jgi:drug/metabolite transporter (DMT)-like permease
VSQSATSASAAVPLVVLAAAVLHAVWNAIAHGSRDKLVGFALMNIAFVVSALVLVVVSPGPDRAAWPFLISSGLLQIPYQLLLVQAYRLGDFAQMYPLARGTSPLLVAIWATAVLGEPLGVAALVGVLMISFGLISLALPRGRPGRDQVPALTAALGTGVMIAAYTIVDGTGVRHAGTVTGYLGWMFLVQSSGLLLICFALRGRRLFSGLGPGTWTRGLIGGSLSQLAYGLVVWAQARGSLATIAALRETSIVIAALIGTIFFHERFGRGRMVASAVVVAGIALLELSHP